MNTYKIYKLNQNVKDLLEQYPEIKEKIITLQPKNVYFTKQLECLFENNDGVSDFIEYKLKQRKDYLRNASSAGKCKPSQTPSLHGASRSGSRFPARYSGGRAKVPASNPAPCRASRGSGNGAC